MCLGLRLDEVHLLHAHQRVGRLRGDGRVVRTALVGAELQRGIQGQLVPVDARQVWHGFARTCLEELLPGVIRNHVADKRGRDAQGHKTGIAECLLVAHPGGPVAEPRCHHTVILAGLCAPHPRGGLQAVEPILHIQHLGLGERCGSALPDGLACQLRGLGVVLHPHAQPCLQAVHAGQVGQQFACALVVCQVCGGLVQVGLYEVSHLLACGACELCHLRGCGLLGDDGHGEVCDVPARV